MDGVGIAEEEYRNEANTEEAGGPDAAAGLPPVEGIENHIFRMLDPDYDDGKHYTQFRPGAGKCKLVDSFVCRYQRERSFKPTETAIVRLEVDKYTELQHVIEEMNKLERKPNSAFICINYFFVF